MTIRKLALVGAIDGERRAEHTAGFPLEAEKMLPVADVVLLIAGADPGAMLFRYTAYGEFAGDTWHQTVSDAEEQAAFEYEDALQPWLDVPDEIADAHRFAVQYAAERLNDRG